jgi:hypothetical protein
MNEQVVVYKLSNGDVAVWHDGSSICIKTRSGYGDPVEIADDEAEELAAILLRLTRHGNASD